MYSKICTRVWLKAQQFKADTAGVSAIEYAVIAAALAALLGVVFADGGSFDAALDAAFNKVTTEVNN